MQYEPVLFVGIGGTATHVLRRLRRRLHDRLGTMNTIPAIEMLLIDTDVKSLNRATDGEYGAALEGDERLPTPLRRSEDYRSTAENILASISRRWLFNVPYSLETNGFRPLGRLAMVDHSKRVLERLRQSLVRITSEESIAKTTEATGLEFALRQPRVFVIASTAGGTGSGMVIEIAYAIRSILAKLDFPDGNVHGILMHSTALGQRDRDKSIANSYAALNELWHYSRPGKCYPGDRGLGLPAFHGNNRTFSSCYFVDLGEGLTELQFDLATDPVAEYLYLSALTPAARFFDKCRQLEYIRWGTELNTPTLRTFGVSQLGGSNSEIPTIMAELLCRDLVHNWRDGLQACPGRTASLLSVTAALSESGAETNRARCAEIEARAAVKAGEIGLDLAQMTSTAHAILDEEVTSGTESYFANLIATRRAGKNPEDHLQIIAAIDSTLTGGDGAVLDSLNTILNTRIEGRATQLATSIRDWLFDLIDEPGGVAGAKHAAEWFQRHLRELQATTTATAGSLRETALARQHAVLRGRGDERASTRKIWSRNKVTHDPDADLREYATAQVEQAVACSVIRWLRLIEAQVNSELERLQVFWRDLTALAGTFQVSGSLDAVLECREACDVLPSNWRELLGELVHRRADLVAALDHDLEKKLAAGPKKLRGFLTEARTIDSQLAGPLRSAARQVILAAMQDISASRLRATLQGSAQSPDYRDCVEAARPASPTKPWARVCCWSCQRAPIWRRFNRAWAPIASETRRSSIPPMATLSPARSPRCSMCGAVAANLIDNRTDFLKAAQRLRTRIDVHWDDMSGSDSDEHVKVPFVDNGRCTRALNEVGK